MTRSKNPWQTVSAQVDLQINGTKVGWIASGTDSAHTPFARAFDPDHGEKRITWMWSHGTWVRYLKPGDVFDTPFERGCVVTVSPGDHDLAAPSTFLALDSDGVECQFDTIMVLGDPDFRNPIV